MCAFVHLKPSTLSSLASESRTVRERSRTTPVVHDELAGHFTVYAPVHPGFAGDPIPDWLYDVHDLSFHNAALIGELGLERPLVVGVSLGGWMALDLACHRAFH